MWYVLTDDDLKADEATQVKTVTVNRRAGRLSNLVYRLLGRNSVSCKWRRQANPQLEYNFDDLTLCGIGFGQLVDALDRSGLGPANEEYAEGCRFLCYEDVGIDIIASDTQGIYHIRLHWWEDDWAYNKSFPGKCRFRGQEIPLTNTTSREAVLKHFGNPDEVTHEEDFSCVDYVVRGGEFSVVFDDDGNLSFIDCTPD